ncbi:Protoporphyrinogen IX dehydrogenase [menaquinone] [Marinibacterium anthonyi]|nr:Protoporphyrinogen IX dehydrogenase [menaquinone] [Marinibacterium anthonyi]
MRILICYATTEGQTRKIARFCADQLISRGHSVEMLRVEDAGDLELALYDAVILAGSVHVGHLQADLADFAHTHAEALADKPTLLLIVSLAVAGKDPTDQAELDQIAAEFARTTAWIPGRIEHVAGAFRFSEYDFFRSMAMRWIAWQRGQTVDPHADTEYTDWAALAALMANWSAAPR